MTTFGGFWKSFFKVTGVPAAIIGYVIFSHERDEKIKEFVNNDIHSKIYGNSANKSNSANDSSPTQENTIQPIVSQSEPNSNSATDRVKEIITLGKQGDAVAQMRLGGMYYKGEGVTKDYGQAVNWFRKGAEQGNADAQMCLGYMYYQGEGVTKDYGQAVIWYRKAAEQGNADAQWRLAAMYYNGEGITKDYGQAVNWFRKGAEQGNADAQRNLALMYYRGQGVVQNYDQAFKWTRKAAEQGNAQGQAMLADMYENEIGVSKNEILAYMLYPSPLKVLEKVSEVCY